MNAATSAAPSETSAEHLSPDQQFDEVDAETRRVMQNRVNPGVKVKYETENVKFILWLFDNREHYGALLKPALVEELAVQHELDRERRTSDGHPSKLRDHVCSTCQEWLRRADADTPTTHPIELRDLTFKIYSRFLNTFKKAARKRSRGAEDETVAIRFGMSSYDGVTLSLTHLYTECGLDKLKVRKDLWAKLKVYKAGSRRISAREKRI